MTTIKERPILFSAPMIRAILDGRKTMTRRVVKPQPLTPVATGSYLDSYNHTRDWCWWMSDGRVMNSIPGVRCPYAVGMRLWIRENVWLPPVVTDRMRRDGADTWPAAIYVADGESFDRDWCKEHDWRSRPSIFMPRWASRITLEITGVRVERLQEIAEPDAIAEGIRTDIIPACGDHPDLLCYVTAHDDGHAYPTARDAFHGSWDQLNANRGFGWESNPFVWCVTFRRITT